MPTTTAGHRPPHHDTDGTWLVSRPADVRQVLAEPRCLVPDVPYAGRPGTIGWLRSHVARFCNGGDHERRRALVASDLARLDIAALRRAAYKRTSSAVDQADEARTVAPRVARRVPVGVLASALGVRDADLEATVDSVIDVAAAYHPGTGSEPVADAAVATLLCILAGPLETVANRIGLLVQACAATAGLIDQALDAALTHDRRDVDALVAETLRAGPPIRATRRHCAVDMTVGGTDIPAGATLLLELATAQLPFGGGTRSCPGQDHAIALAAGVVAALLERTAR
jgi:cytochrome P450